MNAAFQSTVAGRGCALVVQRSSYPKATIHYVITGILQDHVTSCHTMSGELTSQMIRWVLHRTKPHISHTDSSVLEIGWQSSWIEAQRCPVAWYGGVDRKFRYLMLPQRAAQSWLLCAIVLMYVHSFNSIYYTENIAYFKDMSSSVC